MGGGRRTDPSRCLPGTTFGYNDDGRINLISHQDGVAQDLAKFEFTQYDENARIKERITTRTLTGPAGTIDGYVKEAFDYDAYGQLLRVNIKSGNDVNSATSADQDAYRYDKAGNRVKGDVDGVLVEFNSDLENRLVQDDAFDYTYDDQGRRLTKTGRAGTPAQGIAETYTWDHRGLLLKVVHSETAQPTTTVEYGYDAQGRRAARRVTVSGMVTEAAITHYDGQNRIAEFDVKVGSATEDKIARHYLFGTGPNEVLAVDQGGETAWAFADQLGSVATWGTHNGNAWSLKHQSFDAFGNVHGETDDLAVGELPTVWAGHQLDAATGLVHMQARWYDPRSGQFISLDPTRFGAGDSNLYRYVGNDPTNSIDPNGLEEIDITSQTEVVIESLVQDRLATASLGRGGELLVTVTAQFGASINTLVFQHVPSRGERNAAFYRLIQQASFPVSELGFATIADIRRIQGRAQTEIAFRNLETGQLNNTAAKLTFALHLVPTGAAIDFGLQGQLGEAGIALAGDVVLLAGGLSKAVTTGRNTARLQKATVALEGGIGAIRLGQAGIAAANGDTQLAAGHFGEAALRLLGAGALSASVPRTAVVSVPRNAGPRLVVSVPRTPVRRGFGNIGSHRPIAPATALNGAEKFLRAGYKEIAPGVFRSTDGLRQFRMTSRDLLPTHGKIGPHVHFEALNETGKVIENLHVPVLP